MKEQRAHDSCPPEGTASALSVSTVAGQEDCWLLTETLVQSVSLQLKVCQNIQCLALHSFTDLHTGKPQRLIAARTTPSHDNSTNACLVVWFVPITVYARVIEVKYLKIPQHFHLINQTVNRLTFVMSAQSCLNTP